MRTNFHLKAIVFFIFLVVFWIFFKGLKNDNTYVPNSKLEKEIPKFVVKLFDEKNEINSEKIFKGDEFYLMNIWSSWCVPCKYEHEFLVELSKQKNLKIIGLNYKDNIKNAKIFLKELSNPYEIIILDNDGTIAIEWGAYGVPETFLIHKKKIIKKIIGPLDKNLTKEIKDLILL